MSQISEIGQLRFSSPPIYTVHTKKGAEGSKKVCRQQSAVVYILLS